MSNYPYTSGQGVSALDPTTPRGDTDPISDLDDAIRQIKAYLLDNTVGPDAKMAGFQSQITNLQNQFNSSGTKFVPTGTISAYAGINAPAGWLVCNGAEVSRVDYADLYLSIGIGFGPGNSATTFNLPDLRGRVPVGMDQGTNRSPMVSLGSTGGAATHTLTDSEMPAHDHWTHKFEVMYVAHSGPGTTNAAATWAEFGGNLSSTTPPSSGQADTYKSSLTGGNQPHNNMQPYQGVQYIIKV